MALAGRLGAVVVALACIALAVFVVVHPKARPAVAPAAAHAVGALPGGSGSGQKPTTALFLGDSYTNGTIEVGGAGSFAQRACRALELVCNLDAQGGTGYLADGTTADPTFSSYDGRVVADAANYTADVIVVSSGGRSDLQASGNEYSAARQCFEDLKAKFPKAAIVVLEPFWTSSRPPADVANLRDDVHRAAVEAGVSYLDTGSWLTQPGVKDDGKHFNSAGEQRITDHLVDALMNTGRINQTVRP